MEDAADMAASLEAGIGAWSKLNVAGEIRLANGRERNFSLHDFLHECNGHESISRIT
jgi:hypothetical protein